MKNIVRLTLEIAREEVGVREEGGSNRGVRVNQYLQSVGLAPGNPWCASWVFWCIEQAAGKLVERNPFIRTGFCPYISRWANDGRILKPLPAVGDVFLLYGKDRKGIYRAHHTGFVIAVGPNRFGTAEGNTNTTGSPEGIGVFERTRSSAGDYKFVRWENMVEEDDAVLAPSFTLVVSGKTIVNMPIRGGRAMCPLDVWAKAFGFVLGWDNESQMPTFDGQAVPIEVATISGVKCAPVRDLVESAGELDVTVEGRKVIVARKQ